MTAQEKAPVVRRAVILTALSVEYKAVRAHLQDIKEQIDANGTVYEIGNFSGLDGKTWRICILETGAGNPIAATLTERAINYFQPHVVMFVGIAGGLKDVSIGDVVAATKVYGYESGKAKVKVETRPEAPASTHDMQQRARAEARQENWTARIHKPKKGPIRVLVAPIASGEKVVASRRAAVFGFIRSHYGDAVAVEMEGLGCLLAAGANRGVSALVVRGISDLLDKKAKAEASGSQQLAANHASAFAFQVLSKWTLAPSGEGRGAIGSETSAQFTSDGRVDALIKDVRHGDLKSGMEPALELIGSTDDDGRNELFEKLLDYVDCPDDELLWKTLGLLESCSEVAPWLFIRPVLARLARHEDFSVRSTAAFICLNIAQHAPEMLPTDILVKLSVHDEDWYVEAPANAALKSMVRNMPGVLQIFFTRLHSSDSQEQEHAAAALADIADKEPEFLDPAQLRTELLVVGNSGASAALKRAIRKVEGSKRHEGYKYGI